MLKGKMKIELTDVHTGQTETVLEQNMVTNALSEVFKPLGLAKSPNKMLSNYAPYYQKLLGGILLFDTEIEENAADFYPPASANLVGCAAHGEQNNTTGTVRGGYNQTESELNLHERYMKFVYDFATSQANGTIACVCLTHKNGGFTSYGSNNAVINTSYPLMLPVDDGTLQYSYPSCTGANTSDKYSGYTVGVTELLFAIDRETDCAYYFRVDSANSITIISRRAYLRNVSVLENPQSQKAYVDEVSIGDLSINGQLAYFFDPAENCLYIFTADSYYTQPRQEFRVCKIRFGTWAVTQYTMVNTTDVNFATSGLRFAAAHRGFVYLKTYNSPYEIYKFEIGNSANVTLMRRNGMNTIEGVPQFALNGRIYYEYVTSSGYTLCIANEVTEEILKTESPFLYSSSRYSYCFTPVVNEPLLYFLGWGNYSTGCFVMLANYLATINNLSEPVTKTADKTMKVTYIIQEQ